MDKKKRSALSLLKFVALCLAVFAEVAFFLNLAAASAATSSQQTQGAAVSDSPDQGQSVFEQKCKACHTIGGGRLVGPDLKGIASLREEVWLVSFIVAPDRLIAQGDPIARQIVQEYGMPMPNMGVSADEARSILAYIGAQSGSGSSVVETPPTTQALPPGMISGAVAAASPADGERLFTGRQSFENGGPSCLSCHNAGGVGLIGGGTVGKDLTTSFTVFGDTGLMSVMRTAPFPMMREVYSAKPLLEGEIESVAAFLREADATRQSGPAQNPAIFFIASAAGSLVIFALFQTLWRGRLSGVRRSLVKGDSK